MSISNYPARVAQGLTIRGLPLHQRHPGEVFWVNNSSVLPKGGVAGSDSNKGTYQRPFSTIDYAIGRCTASRGDIVKVMPGHAETISTTTFALAGINQDVAGVAVVGLGTGLLRPTITFDTDVDATWAVTAANCSISNMVFIGNFLSVKSAITNSAGPGMTVEHCMFKDTDAILGILAAVTTTVSVDADDMWIANNHRHSIATTTPGSLVNVVGTIAGVTISDNVVFHTVAENGEAAILNHAALVVTELVMERNSVYGINTDQSGGGILIKTSATTGSGIVSNNMVKLDDPAGALMVTAAAVQYGFFENYLTGDDDASGVILPARGEDTP